MHYRFGSIFFTRLKHFFKSFCCRSASWQYLQI
jgi:hypothetical protein